jgi:hypothetical protein
MPRHFLPRKRLKNASRAQTAFGFFEVAKGPFCAKAHPAGFNSGYNGRSKKFEKACPVRPCPCVFIGTTL